MYEPANKKQELDVNDGIENGAVYPKYSLFTALTMLNDEYGVELDDDTFIERGYKIWRTIGNKAQAYHILRAPVDENQQIWLPPNLEDIDSVTSIDAYKDLWGSELLIYNNTTKVINQDYLIAVVTNDYLANRLLNDRRSRIEGLYLEYTHNGDHIIIKSEDMIGTEVIVLYKGIISDEQALPRITYKEAEAIAAGVAFIHYKKLALLGDTGAAQLLQLLKEEKDRLIGLARIPDSISNNQMDRILDANGSFDRKNYNKSYKFNGY